MKRILLFAFLQGCVVPYGEAPQTSTVEAAASSPMGDLTGLEARLLLLIDGNQEADRASRLEALRSLLRRSRTWPPEAQRDLAVYLEAILAVEDRWREDQGIEGFEPLVSAEPMVESVGVGSDGGGTALAVPVMEESLANGQLPAPPVLPPEGADDPVVDTPARDARAIKAEQLVRARQALAQGEYLEAISFTVPGDQGEPDPELLSLRQEAVDGWVHLERERAGRLFLDARDLADLQQRRTAYEQVVVTLQGLLESYPESTYSQAITRNLQLVQRELAALE